MPGMSGLELQKELTARGIDLPTIIITGFADVRIAVEAMKAGAVEFLEKPFRTQELCDHIQRAVKLDVANWQQRQERAEVQRHLSALTRAEKQVLALILAGKTNRLMAGELDLSVRTIEDRRAPIDAEAGGQVAGGTHRVDADRRRRVGVKGRAGRLNRRQDHAGHSARVGRAKPRRSGTSCLTKGFRNSAHVRHARA